MIASPPSSEYVSRRPTNRTANFPSFAHRTPSRRGESSYRLPLTPSPNKPRPMPSDSIDDVFSSPVRSSSPGDTKACRMTLNYDFDDDDDDLAGDDSGFAEDHSVFNSRILLPPPSSSPFALRTPVKQSHHGAERLGRPLLTVSTANTPHSPGVTTIGTKRKPSPLSFATPERQRTLTPLRTTGSSAFDRLAPRPLSAPRFGSHTPRTKAETEECLKSGEDSLTRLGIKDYDMTTTDSGFDSGPEGHSQDGGSSLLTDRANTSTLR